MLEPFKELEDEEPDLACIIWLYLEDFFFSTIVSPKDNPTSTIRSRMLGKMAGLWTNEPCFMVALTE